MGAVLDGGCLCGAVRYRIDAAPVATSNCHCTSCRRAAGATPVAWTVVPVDALVFTRGTPARFASSPGVTRSFCGVCGTTLTYDAAREVDTIDVTTASLDRPDDSPPVREIWLEDRLAWVAIDSRLPHHAQGGNQAPMAPAT